VKKNVTWICGICNEQYDNEEDATQCEKDCKATIISKSKAQKFNILFPSSHIKDYKYAYHCVDCGILVQEYRNEMDGIDSTFQGELVFEIKDHTYLLGGHRCPKCSIPVKKWIEQSQERERKFLIKQKKDYNAVTSRSIK
jgi:hypothetical protein